MFTTKWECENGMFKMGVSVNTKFRHYCSVNRPEALYAAKRLALNGERLIKKLEAEERKIQRDAETDQRKWRLQPTV